MINTNWHPISYRFGVIAVCSNFGHFTFLSPNPPLGLGATYDVYLGLIGKRVVAEAPETVRGRGQANAGGARALEYSLGIRGDKTLNTRRIQLWHCCYCDMWQIQMHIQWCRHQMFINNCQSLKLSTVYSSLFVDFDKLLGHLFRRHVVYSSCVVYHTVLMQMQLWIVLQKRAFLCPRAPPYNKGSRGSGSGAPA